MNDPAMHCPDIWVCWLGTIPYREALFIQETVRALRQADELPDMLLLLEHPPVYTRGRRSLDGELSLGEGFYRSRGIEVVSTDRGGRVTYHGPGQLVGYPIMRVSDIGGHLRTMETAIVAALEQEGIVARSRWEEGPDYTGVWVQERKIASIGVHVSRGVSTHGFAINVTNDLEPFDWIVPCGLSGVRMTSVERELYRAGDERQAVDEHDEHPVDEHHVDEHPVDEDDEHHVDEQRFAERVACCFAAAHGRIAKRVEAVELGIELGVVA
jgi:lipoyl(octanoyl) transferase